MAGDCPVKKLKDKSQPRAHRQRQSLVPRISFELGHLVSVQSRPVNKHARQPEWFSRPATVEEGIKGKSGVQTGVGIEYIKIKIRDLQGFRDIFREVSPDQETV